MIDDDAAVLLAALTADALLGEPASAVHPVALLGKLVERVMRLEPDDPGARLAFGGVLTVGSVFVAGGAGLLVDAVARRLPRPIGIALRAAMLKSAFSARALWDSGSAVESALERGELDRARYELRSLVSRDASELDPPLVVSAAVESVAENTVDSIVAPLLCFAGAGLPGALAYRAVNTLDAMIGYRGRYEHTGRVAARLDDALNWVPARVTAALLLVGGALSGGDVASGLDVMRRDGGSTASPNAGRPMATMAGLLGVRLEKPGHYVLGKPLPRPDLVAIDHAIQISRAATAIAAGALACLSGLRRAQVARP
ncbi:MAG: adenosylcobinamide-phosphate synthase CbiB [Chloroflexota bacterium]